MIEQSKRRPGRPRAEHWPLEPYTLKLSTEIIDGIPSRQWAQEITTKAVQNIALHDGPVSWLPMVFFDGKIATFINGELTCEEWVNEKQNEEWGNEKQNIKPT